MNEITSIMTRAEKLIWGKLEVIEKLLSGTKRKRMFNGLLINDIVKDIKVSAEFVINEWILTGRLKAVNVGGKDRVRGGWRVSVHDYIEFLEQLTKSEDREEEKAVFIKSPEQIIKDFQKEHGLLKEKKKRKK